MTYYDVNTRRVLSFLLSRQDGLQITPVLLFLEKNFVTTRTMSFGAILYYVKMCDILRENRIPFFNIIFTQIVNEHVTNE